MEATRHFQMISFIDKTLAIADECSCEHELCRHDIKLCGRVFPKVDVLTIVELCHRRKVAPPFHYRMKQISLIAAGVNIEICYDLNKDVLAYDLRKRQRQIKCA